VLCAQEPALYLNEYVVCVITAPLSICSIKGASLGMLLMLAVPSLLAFVAIAGFVVVQAVLKLSA